MKEIEIRKYHRYLGIFISVLVIIQASSGLILTFHAYDQPTAHADSGHDIESEKEAESPLHEALETIHSGGGSLGLLYRTGLGFGLLLMVATGSLIFYKIRIRQSEKTKSSR